MRDDPVARELTWLDGIFANPENRLLFQDGAQTEVERELSARWSGENRLELLNGLAAEFGEVAVLSVIDGVIDSNCRKDWREIGRKSGKSLANFIKLLWAPLADMGFEYTYGQEGRETRFRVTRCPVASMAREMGAEKWLYHLACLTDEPSITGFNEHIRFSRSYTLMQGHELCDHRYQDTTP
jgi:hypothetical protein